MGRLSRQKGKRVEREAAAALAAVLGIEARRSVQYSGRAGDADLQTSLPGIHFEVKARAGHACLRFHEQATSDAGLDAVPVVMLREDGDPRFYALVALDHLPQLAATIVARGQA